MVLRLDRWTFNWIQLVAVMPYTGVSVWSYESYTLTTNYSIFISYKNACIYRMPLRTFPLLLDCIWMDGFHASVQIKIEFRPNLGKSGQISSNRKYSIKSAKFGKCDYIRFYWFCDTPLRRIVVIVVDAFHFVSISNLCSVFLSHSLNFFYSHIN